MLVKCQLYLNVQYIIFITLIVPTIQSHGVAIPDDKRRLIESLIKDNKVINEYIRGNKLKNKNKNKKLLQIACELPCIQKMVKKMMIS